MCDCEIVMAEFTCCWSKDEPIDVLEKNPKATKITMLVKKNSIFTESTGNILKKSQGKSNKESKSSGMVDGINTITWVILLLGIIHCSILNII